ncbi:MAG TPA: hypothetical protein DCX91_10645, partial [Stenotrophomonas sp.]|nr:hypothetical protein [Stenotrophomonas sp.]
MRLGDSHYGMGSELSPIPGTGSPAIYRWSENLDVEQWEMMGMPFVLVPGAIIAQEDLDILFLWGFIGENPLELNDWGLGDTIAQESEGTAPDYENRARPAREQLFSVLRTGTGDLDLVSGGDLQMRSLYGIYTAGTASAATVGSDGRDPYNLPRGLLTDGSLLWKKEGTAYQHLVDGGEQSLYSAWYPDQGGNVLLRAGGDIHGDLV